MISLTMPMTEWVTMNSRYKHPRVRDKKLAHIRARAHHEAITTADPVPTPCIRHVMVTWPDERRRDVENFAPSVKAMTDGITSAGVIPDDSDEHVWGSWWHRPTVDHNLAGTARVAIWFEPVEES